jgi:hypothetical protein
MTKMANKFIVFSLTIFCAFVTFVVCHPDAEPLGRSHIRATHVPAGLDFIWLYLIEYFD